VGKRWENSGAKGTPQANMTLAKKPRRRNKVLQFQKKWETDKKEGHGEKEGNVKLGGGGKRMVGSQRWEPRWVTVLVKLEKNGGGGGGGILQMRKDKIGKRRETERQDGRKWESTLLSGEDGSEDSGENLGGEKGTEVS